MQVSSSGKISFRPLTFICLIILLIAGGWLLYYLHHRVPSNTVVKIVIEGNLAEESSSGLAMPSGKTETMKDLLVTLDTISRDPHVVGVVFEIKPFKAGFGSFPVPAKIQELRDEILAVNQAGKWTAAYLSDADETQYYLASVCKEIFLLPTGSVLFNGIALSSPFVRGLLDKAGIKPELQHIGQYKTFSNMFTEKKFTPAHKEMDSWILDSLWKQLLGGVSAARNIPQAKVALLADQGVFLGQDAVKAKLVDKIAYPDEFTTDLQSEHGAYTPMNWNAYLSAAGSRYWGTGKKIAIVYASGDIVGEESGYNFIEGKTMGAETLSKAFEAVRKDPSIKAVVFRIDSPGGEVTTSDLIRQAAQLTAQKIPVVVSMSDVAGSGGYWITTFSPPPVIYADPATLTASIGVVGGKFDFKIFFENLGITFDTISRGKTALLGSLTHSSPEENQAFQGLIAGMYDQFISKVAESRRMSKHAVDSIGRGRVFTGEQAKQKGLVDHLGGLLQAIQTAKQEAGISPFEPVDLVVFPKPESFLEALANALQGNSNISLQLPWRSNQALVLMQP